MAEYALNYANGKMRSCVQNGMDAFAGVGMAYINLAFDEPNLFQYLYMSGEGELRAGGFDVLVHAEANAAMAAQIADDLKIPKENVSSFFQNTMIYTHGLACFVASGVITSSKEEVIRMVRQAALTFLSQAGAKTNLEENNDNK